MKELSEDIKKKIFELITVPGIEIKEISETLNIDYDTVMEILCNEYFKHNLDHGRRLCCR